MTSSMTGRIRRQICQRFQSIHSAGSYKLPAYQHDQCERSLHMHLFTMEKRDITLLLVLTIAFNAFCIMVASFAPKSHILDTTLLGKSIANSRSNQQQEANHQYYLLSDESVGDPSRDQDQTVEMRVMTEPLSAINRPINFMLEAEFDLTLENNHAIDTVHNFSQNALATLIGSYQLEWLLAAYDNDSSSGNKSNCTHDNNLCEKNTQEWPNHNNDIGQSVTESLNVMFYCRKSLALDADVKQPLDTSKGYSFRCRSPKLGFTYKISDFRRSRYQLSISINEFNFLTAQDTKPRSNPSDERIIIDLKLLETNSIEMALTMSYTNSSFTYLTIFIHMLFLIISLCIGCCFILCLIKHPIHLWSLEQKLTSLLFVLLIAANRPFYTLEILGWMTQPAHEKPVFIEHDLDGEQPSSLQTKIGRIQSLYEMMDSVLDLTFVCGLLLSWTCFAHSLRQISRPFYTFYLPKLALVGAIWLMALTALFLVDADQLKWRPIVTHPDQTKLDAAFYVALIAYIACLVYHFVCTAIELKPMSYFIIRYRTQATLCVTVLIDYATIVLLSPSYQSQLSVYQIPQLNSNTSDSITPNLMRQTAGQASRYRSTHREPSGAPSSYSADSTEFASRWKVDATDQPQSSLLDLLPQEHSLDSACGFLCYVMVNNLYVLVCAYLYWPVLHSAPIPCKLLPSAIHYERPNLRATVIDS